MKLIYKPSALRRNFYFYFNERCNFKVVEFQSKRMKIFMCTKSIKKKNCINNEFD